MCAQYFLGISILSVPGTFGDSRTLDGKISLSKASTVIENLTFGAGMTRNMF